MCSDLPLSIHLVVTRVAAWTELAPNLGPRAARKSGFIGRLAGRDCRPTDKAPQVLGCQLRCAGACGCTTRRGNAHRTDRAENREVLYATIHRMVTNPIYGGAYAYGRTGVVAQYGNSGVGTKSRRKPRAEWLALRLARTKAMSTGSARRRSAGW
jgi:hypothetical protein